MVVGRGFSGVVRLLVLSGICLWAVGQAGAQAQPASVQPAAADRQAPAKGPRLKQDMQVQRKAAAARLKAAFPQAQANKRSVLAAPAAGSEPAVLAAPMAMPMPGGGGGPGAVPHYFGPYSNYANSPLPKGPVAAIALEEGGEGYAAPVVMISDVYGTGSGAAAKATVTDGVITGIELTRGGSGYSAPVVTIMDDTGEGAMATAVIGSPFEGGIRKFVDSLPGPTAAGANNLGQYIPVAIPDTTRYPGSDYYEIELGQYTEKLHSDLPATLLRGYRQINTSDPTVSKFHYLGPLIVAKRDTPVRIKFTNKLPTGAGGDLFLPVDTTVMGAGMGPLDMPGMPGMKEMYTQNRATLHLHGGLVPWISDGTPHQWTTPAGESTSYPKGVSVQNVPDMPAPGDGSLTFYYNNQQSARLMFYHDHAYGITRLNVYAGEAAGYLLTDQVEQDLINGTNVTGVNPSGAKLLPDLGIPLIIQDKTFVDASTIGYQDPTWRWGSMPGMPMTGDLWLPSVYMPAQNPYDLSGMNPFGRWQYGPWFWPPTTGIAHGPVPNEYYDPTNTPWEPPMRPDMPNPSMGMEAFMDTPLVNGTVYPSLTVEPKAYRFRILNAANDRFWNLQWYYAEPLTVTLKAGGSGYTSAPAVTFTGGGASVPAAATAAVSGGVSDIAVTSGGTGYTSAPQVTITGGGGTGATATATMTAGIVTGVTLTNGGDGYTSVPTITFTGGSPTTPATATATIDGYLSGLMLASGGVGYTSAPTVTLAGGGTGAAATANISGGVDGVTVAAGGEGYTSAPAVVFTGGGATTPAVATATVSGGVSAIAVTSGGAGYISAPTVTLTGGGATTPATATATMTGGISSVAVTGGGAGYTSAPAVTFTGGGATTPATAVATISNTLAAITVTNRGSGYSANPTVTLIGGAATPATATATVARGVTSISVTQNGRNYTSPPTVAISGGGGAGAAAVATINNNGRVTGITVTSPGTGYTTTPTVTLTGGGGRSAQAVASISRYISGITLTNPGAGYISAPTVAITDSTGTGAAATATTAGTVTAVTITDPGTDYTSAPAITFTGGGATTSATATATIGGVVTGIAITSPGAGYTSAPVVEFTGGGAATQATATASIASAVTGVTIIDPGAGYTSAPTVVFMGGGATTPAAATASLAGVVTGLTITNPGTGYTSAPAVEFTGGGATTPATATATITSAVSALTLTDPGAGYTSAPTVEFTGGGATTPATATAVIGGTVTGVTVTDPGTGYTSAPMTTFTGGGATIPAVATATIAGRVTAITVTDPGVGYTSAPVVSITGGGGTGAAALASVGTEVTMVPAVKTPGYPATWSIDGREGGVPDPKTAGPAWIQIGTEGGFLPAPVAIPNQPINWNANATAFNVGNVSDHSLLLGCAERADVIVDFSQYAGKTLILYNDAPAAFPALDPRYDYYTGNPDLTGEGGTPPTQAGYGPNTRTIMQIRVTGTPSAAPPANYYNPATLAALKTAFAKTDTKRGVFEVSQDPIIVPQAAYNSAYNTTTFPADWRAYVRIFDTAVTFTPIGATTPVTISFQPKAIHDEMGAAYDTEYGRMSGTLGLELIDTNNLNQNFLLYGYASPPVDILQDSMTPIGTLADGTQIWKITHNGVDTHPIHFHLANVQLINRVAWDGALMPPDPNELGWKDTIRVNPLEDTIIAMRPMAPTQPFDVPNSVRLIDPTMPEGAPLMTPPGGYTDPAANPVTVLNHYANFGWEYVWHCHILSHEEMDMMHSLAFAVAPKAPSNLKASVSGSGPNRRVTLAWTDNSANETGFTIQRAADAGFTTGLTSFKVGENVMAYIDAIGGTTQPFFYRVFANNVVGDTAVYAGSPDGFPTRSMDSPFSNIAATGAVPPSAAPSNLTATVNSSTRVTLTWRDNANNETGFVVERSTNAGAFAQIATPGPRNNTGNVNYTDTTVAAGNTYVYRVKAVNGTVSSGYATSGSVVLAAAPAAPSNLAATAVNVSRNNDRVTLTWTDNAANETGFTIQRAINAAFTAGLTTITAGANATTLTQNGVARGRTYWYRVRATNTGGTSAWSNVFSITTP